MDEISLKSTLKPRQSQICGGVNMQRPDHLKVHFACCTIVGADIEPERRVLL